MLQRSCLPVWHLGPVDPIRQVHTVWFPDVTEQNPSLRQFLAWQGVTIKVNSWSCI